MNIKDSHVFSQNKTSSKALAIIIKSNDFVQRVPSVLLEELNLKNFLHVDSMLTKYDLICQVYRNNYI